ncbi:MAG: hypothetical protein R6X15_05695 [Pseudomonadota bacterium]
MSWNLVVFGLVVVVFRNQFNGKETTGGGSRLKKNKGKGMKTGSTRILLSKGLRAVMLGVVLGLTGCGGSSDKSYDISTSAVPAEGGTVSGGGSYDDGDQVTVTATPNDGYSFSSWTAGNSEVSTSASYSFSAEQDRNLTAHFVLNSYSVGGVVSGLEGSGLVLQTDGGDELSIDKNDIFYFDKPLKHGETYNVTVKTHPTNLNQTCTVENGKGTVDAAKVNDIAVTCTTNTYYISGRLTGLDNGVTLVLQNNEGDDLSLTDNSGFIFDTKIPDGEKYDVSVKTQPTDQVCTVTSGSGTVNGGNVTNIGVNCITYYSVGGTVSGLGSGETVTLQNPGTTDLTVSKNGKFTFTPKLENGSSYNVSVTAQPADKVCAILRESGTLNGGPVTDVTVTCVAKQAACAAVFANDSFVDYSADRGTSSHHVGSEAYNVEKILSHAGITVNTFTGYTATDFTNAVNACAEPISTLVIPEQENGYLGSYLTTSAKNTIKNFVLDGGNLVLAADRSSRYTALANTIFSWSTGRIADLEPLSLNTEGAAGTPFEGGTAEGGTTLSQYNATEAVGKASLPSSSRVIYEDNYSNASVAMIQVGSGTVTLVGFSYYNAAPVGVDDGGWREVLIQAATADALEMKIPLTNVATADLQNRGWSECFSATYDDGDTLFSEALGACNGSEMMMACRQTGSGTLTVGAWNLRHKIITDTGTDTTTTNDMSGVSWYYNRDTSWGFAPLGSDVNKVPCDTSTVDGEQRLCWNGNTVGDNTFDGGFRCGTTTGLDASTTWERVLLER